MSSKNLTLISDPDSTHKVEVTLTPLGSKIKYRITGEVFCSRNNGPLPNSRTYKTNDIVWNAVFGSQVAVKKFLKNNRVVKMVMPISFLGYKECDSVRLKRNDG